MISRGLLLLGTAGMLGPGAAAAAQESRVAAVATEYMTALIERVPELATQRGIPGARHDRFTDNSLAALDRWKRRENAWLTSVRALPAPAVGAADWSTYQILRETLEASVAQRVCRFELWGVNSLFGWQASFPALARAQTTRWWGCCNKMR